MPVVNNQAVVVGTFQPSRRYESRNGCSGWTFPLDPRFEFRVGKLSDVAPYGELSSEVP